MKRLPMIEKRETTTTTTTKLNHVRTYIHTYMERRNRNNDTVDLHFIFYEKKELETLKQHCFINNTNVSSVLSNLVREFNLLLQSNTPQTTLFNYDEEAKTPFYMDVDEKESWIKSLTNAQLKQVGFEINSWHARFEKVRRQRDAV